MPEQPDPLANLRVLSAAFNAAAAVLTRAEMAFVEEARKVPSSALIGLAANDPLVGQVMDGVDLDKDVAIGAAKGSVFHSLDPWEYSRTACRRPVRDMLVVSGKGRRWCKACSNAK